MKLIKETSQNNEEPKMSDDFNSYSNLFTEIPLLIT